MDSETIAAIASAVAEILDSKQDDKIEAAIAPLVDELQQQRQLIQDLQDPQGYEDTESRYWDKILKQ